MKKILMGTALSLALAGTHLHAGSLADPQIAAPIVAAEASSSSTGAALPVALAVFMALALAAGTPASQAGSVSDIRLKTDIRHIGTTAHNLPLYQFRYIGQSQMYEGVMAQDVLKVMPEAVVPFAFGYHAVNYGMLGIEMKKVH